MEIAFEIISDDYCRELGALRTLVAVSSQNNLHAKVRIAASNSATLLLAATFEQFIREMAREYARAVVQSVDSFERLPAKIASTAWKRIMDGLSKVQLDMRNNVGRGSTIAAAQVKFSLIYDFCNGDLTKDIYADLIHNENNMRPTMLNSLFVISDLKDVCQKMSFKFPILEFFGESEPGKAHGKLIAGLESFFERRNSIAHALNHRQSDGPTQIENDIAMFECVGLALLATLKENAPAPA
ncbi:MAG: HEPN domain-containing protein [Duganella sp.]